MLGLAVLSALYFSQARDVKRLREWAGRAPERVVEAESGGRPTVQPVPGRATPAVSPAKPVEAGATAAKPAGAAAGAKPAVAAAAGAKPAVGGVKPAVVGAKPAAAGAAGAAAQGGDAAPSTPGKPVPAGATADAATGEAEKADAEPAVAAASAEERAGAPAAATPAGAAASGAASGVPTVAGAAATTAERGTDGGEPPRDTQTGVKVLPAERAQAPVRRPPTLPRTSGQTSVLGEQLGSRPPARDGTRWPAPRYIALIVAGVIILGLGGVVGVMELTKEDASQKPGSNPPETDIGDPTSEPDKPEPTRVNPADVTVAVFNTTQTTGLASRISSRLQSAGFQAGNIAQAGERQRAESVVMFKPDFNDEARAVARKLGISQIEPIDQPSLALAGQAQVVVLLGADKASQ